MKKILILFTGLLIASLSLKAQSSIPTDAYAYFTINGSQSNGFFKVVLPSVSGISAIKVQLGSTSESYDLVNYEFVFDVTTGLPAGYSYSRNNKECILGVGVFIEPPTCFGEVQLKDTSGNWGTPIKFISN